jgi:hypothetical protein
VQFPVDLPADNLLSLGLHADMVRRQASTLEQSGFESRATTVCNGLGFDPRDA